MNIRNCNDEFFFVVTNWIAVAISITSIILASMAIHRYTRRPEGGGRKGLNWTSAIAYLFCDCIYQALRLVHHLILLFDPPTPYWVRMLPYSLAWVAAFLGLYPYMMEMYIGQDRMDVCGCGSFSSFLPTYPNHPSYLTSVKSSAILPQAQYGSTSVRMGQFWCCAAMVLVFISVGTQNAAEGLRDSGFPEISANMLTGSFILASVAGTMDAWVLWWYALRMAKMVKVKLAVEEASYRMAVETTLSRPALPSFREMMCREDRVADEAMSSNGARYVAKESRPQSPAQTSSYTSEDRRTTSTSPYRAIHPMTIQESQGPDDPAVKYRVLILKMESMHATCIFSLLAEVLLYLIMAVIPDTSYRVPALSRFLFIATVLAMSISYCTMALIMLFM